MQRACITGTGHYVPPSVMTNEELARKLGSSVSPAAIERTTGIQERRVVREEGVGASGLGREAATRALDAAGLEPEDIDCIVFATVTPDQLVPGSGVLLQRQLGISERGIPAFDIRNQCSGFLYGLQMAESFICAGRAERVLLVGAELHSATFEFNDRGRSFAVLFGDGAGAAVLEAAGPGESRGISGLRLHSDGRFSDQICLAAPGTRFIPYLRPEHMEKGLTFPTLDGPLVFK